ncbi:hypothetical protein VCJ_001658 [Vibrio metoecus]|nr:hypothetical protein VCJ_001658 [Vibrio metoecus]
MDPKTNPRSSFLSEALYLERVQARRSGSGIDFRFNALNT